MALSRKRKEAPGPPVCFRFLAAAAVSAVVALVYLSVSQQPAVYDEDTLCLVGEPQALCWQLSLTAPTEIPAVIAQKAISRINDAVNGAAPTRLRPLHHLSQRRREYVPGGVTM